MDLKFVQHSKQEIKTQEIVPLLVPVSQMTGDLHTSAEEDSIDTHT